ncbi:hypothetical protein KIPB_011303 [Kipferlia bialata]|uniref:Uncharacterized protein n=1 Tax=Kipferlia bialata TaxID=797122 RepID=A0A9K3GNN0_9EUKA|nr:hypothetical protein KIPB_011303 [Kipferlia bialata]|eukprot:g11303.t1
MPLTSMFVDTVQVLDWETSKWDTLPDDITPLSLFRRRACVSHEGAVYIRGSRDLWRKYTPDSGLVPVDITRPRSLLPRRMVSVGRYLLTWPDQDYAYRVSGEAEGLSLYDLVSDEFVPCKSLPVKGSEVLACMVTPTQLLVANTEGGDMFLLDLAPDTLRVEVDV